MQLARARHRSLFFLLCCSGVVVVEAASGRQLCSNSIRARAAYRGAFHLLRRRLAGRRSPAAGSRVSSSSSSSSNSGSTSRIRALLIKSTKTRLPAVVAASSSTNNNNCSGTPYSPSKNTTPTGMHLRLPDQALVVKCVYISWCAALGCLARLYTDSIGNGNLALEGSFLSNAIGSFALGILSASDLNEDTLPHLYTGLTVGFCGAYTTYSGWSLRMARAALRHSVSGPDGAIVTVVGVLVSLSFFVACFVAGTDLVKTFAAHGRAHWTGDRSALNVRAGHAMWVLGCLYALLAVLLVVDNRGGRRPDWVACMFAPFGALARFCLSRTLNTRWGGGAFPLGTFVANVSGSLAIALAHYGTLKNPLSGWNSIVLKGFQAGFLGSLTTMSSFVGEVFGHREKHSAAASYFYLAATVIVALSVQLIVGASFGV